MNRSIHASLLAGASALAIGMGLASQPAQAFNEVNWEWDAKIWEVVKKYVDIDVYLDPTGMVMLEDLQVHIGDLKAESVVYGIYNDPPEGGKKTVYVDLGDFEVEGKVTKSSFYIDGKQTGGDVDLEPELEQASVKDLEPDYPKDYGTFKGVWDLGKVAIEIPGAATTLDALKELPEVVSAATAVANNTSITTDTSVQLHEGQFAVGDTDYVSHGDLLGLGVAALLGGELASDGVNSNLVGAAVLGSAALLGAIDTANIQATSSVHAVKNATVDSSATAVANNLTIEANGSGDDRLVIGDVVQLAVADVTAKSYVSHVSINDYTNLGKLTRPIVSSVATAVGNNKSITVGPIAPVAP